MRKQELEDAKRAIERGASLTRRRGSRSLEVEGLIAQYMQTSTGIERADEEVVDGVIADYMAASVA